MLQHVVEKMKEDHLDAVLQIYTHYILNTTATFHEEVLTRDEMRELVFFPNSHHQTFVVLDGDEVCGYAYIAPHKKREAYDATAEVTIYLKPGEEGKGIGSLVFRQLEEYARQHDFHVLIATICSQNEASLRLFERNGFERCAHYKEVGRKFGQWLDIIACQKILR